MHYAQTKVQSKEGALSSFLALIDCSGDAVDRCELCFAALLTPSKVCLTFIADRAVGKVVPLHLNLISVSNEHDRAAIQAGTDCRSASIEALGS